QPVEVRTTADTTQPQIQVSFHVDPDTVPHGDWFASYRGTDGRMALRTARQIMRLQGGGLALEENPAGDFKLTLGFADADKDAASQGARRSPSSEPAVGSVAERTGGSMTQPGERVLIVDDSREVRRAYREALAALGYTVLEAADAEQALAALEGARPEVALIDIHLPRMNGYRLAQAIRARAGAGIYLVMLSGMALDAVTRGLAREAGFDESLDKMAGPIALRDLLEAGRRRGGGL
ncbi:MAG: response regulator, partial [Steroidobacteraceae bacterium]